MKLKDLIVTYYTILKNDNELLVGIDIKYLQRGSNYVLILGAF